MEGTVCHYLSRVSLPYYHSNHASCDHFCFRFINRRGVTIGDITILVEAKKLVGTRCVSIKSGPKGVLHLEKQWSSRSSFYAYQTTVMVMKLKN